MIDLKSLRSDPERFRESLRRRGSDIDFDEVVSLEEAHRSLLGQVEELRAQQNKASKAVAQAADGERQAAISEAKASSERLKSVEQDLALAAEKLDAAIAGFPNLVHPDVPEGASDEHNAMLREWGEASSGGRDHLDLGAALDVIDTESASRVSGSRFGYLKGSAALLELSLVRFAMDRATEKGFTPVIPPVLVKREAMFATGFFPTDEQQVYRIGPGTQQDPDEEWDDLYLVGTSEVPLAGLHGDEILEPDRLPLRYAGFSTCFRREAGAHGRDTRGIIRVHQFDKVEMFSFVEPDSSESEHEFLLSQEEETFQALEIPYRVVDVCAGELGAPYSRKFDIEAWLPGAERWLEVTSCSNALDYQARRMGIRIRGEDGNRLVHTLNGTAIAIQRAIVAIFENHQQPDGSIAIPKALHPYTGFESIGEN